MTTKSIVHLSDPHFGTENPRVVSAVVDAVSRISPEIIVVSGDLTQRARCSQFYGVSEFLNSLPAVPKLVIPGNHDIPLFNPFRRFISPYGNYHKFFTEREGVILTENLVLAGCDATTPYRHTRGELSVGRTRARLEHLSAYRSSSKLFGLVIHQPVVVSRQTDLQNILINSSELCGLFSEFKVDFILSGHIHFPLLCSVRDFNPSLSWGTLFSGAGTAVSHRVRDNIPNSFNSLVFEESRDTILLQRHDFSANNNAFLVVEAHMYARDSLGWTRRS